MSDLTKMRMKAAEMFFDHSTSAHDVLELLLEFISYVEDKESAYDSYVLE